MIGTWNDKQCQNNPGLVVMLVSSELLWLVVAMARGCRDDDGGSGEDDRESITDDVIAR